MKKSLLSLFILFFVASVSVGQVQKQTTITSEDEDIVFTLAEVMHTYKGGVQEFEKYLASQISVDSIQGEGSASYMFVVSKTGNISDITKYAGDFSFGPKMKSALLNSSGNWNSALQNNNPVKCYARIKVKFHDKHISVEIFENKPR